MRWSQERKSEEQSYKLLWSLPAIPGCLAVVALSEKIPTIGALDGQKEKLVFTVKAVISDHIPLAGDIRIADILPFACERNNTIVLNNFNKTRRYPNIFADYSADGSSKDRRSVSVAAFLVPVLDAKMPPKQKCRINGTLFVPKNVALTEGGENGAN